jgi:hypothetical protein
LKVNRRAPLSAVAATFDDLVNARPRQARNVGDVAQRMGLARFDHRLAHELVGFGHELIGLGPERRCALHGG